MGIWRSVCSFFAWDFQHEILVQGEVLQTKACVDWRFSSKSRCISDLS